VVNHVANLHSATSIDSVDVTGVVLPVTTTLKSLGVILDQQLTFNEHATAVVKSCNYHARVRRSNASV